MARILGIDPGINGGAALYVTGGTLDDPQPRLADAIDLPTTGEKAKRRIDAGQFFRWVVAMRPDHAFIERAQAMPKQGSSSGFLYGRAVGALEAIVQCANVPLHIIEPTAWKKYFGLIKTDKENSRQKMILLVPSSAELVARKMDHGRAEAGLIAIYGAKVLGSDAIHI